jgi:hypothetical protein
MKRNFTLHYFIVLTLLMFTWSIRSSAQSTVASDDCPGAPMICDLNNYTGNTSSSYTPDCTTCGGSSGGDYSNICQTCGQFDGSIENNSWITFTAAATLATLQFDVSNCHNSPPNQGIQFGIYSGSNCDNFNLLTPLSYTSISGGLGEGTFQITASPLTVGNIYYIMVDGFGGDVCDYTITVVNGVATGNITGTATVCTGQSGVMYVMNTNATGFTWTVPFGASITSGQGTSTITVNWGTATSGNVTCTTTAGLCPGTVASFPVTVTAGPTPTASNNGPVCFGSPLSLTSSPGGMTSYSWSGPNSFTSTAQNPTVSASATSAMAGIYTVTVTNGTCPGTNTTTVSIYPQIPPYNVTGGGAYCSGQGGVDVGLSGSDAGVTYQLVLNGSTNIGSAVTGTGSALDFGNQALAGTYTVVATNTTTNCKGNMTGSAVVTINASPTPYNVTGGGSYCTGGSGLPVGLSNSQSGVSYQLQLNGTNVGSAVTGTGSAISFGNQTAAGTYTVVASGGAPPCTGNMNGSVTITITTVPTAYAGPDVSICTGESVTLNATGGTSYSWSPSTALSSATIANPVASPTSNITYVVTVSDGLCSATDNVAITVNTAPIAFAGNDVVICSGSNTALQASGGSAYLWSPSTGLSSTTIANPVASPTSTMTYTVVVGTGSCTDADDVVVNVNASPVAFAGNDVGICTGESTTLNATGGSSYSWSPSTGLSQTNVANPVANPTSTITYIVTVFAGNGCSATDDVTVNVNAAPPASAGPPSVICNGESATLTASGGSSYAWSNGALTASTVVNPNITTTYTVTVSNSTSCTATASVTITVKPFVPPTINSTGPMGYCDGSTDPITLFASGGYSSYQWSNGATTQVITITGLGTYWVIGTAANGCSDTSAVVVIQNLPSPVAPIILADGPTDFCEGDTISVNLYTNNPYYAYHWSAGSVTPIIHVSHTGYYNVTVTDSNGCTAVSQNTIHVKLIPKPVAYMNYNAAGTYVNFYDFSLQGQSYYWDFGDGTNSSLQNPDHTYTASGVYTVTYIVSNACGSDTSIVIVTIFSGAGIEETEYLHDFYIYPNPTSNDLNLVFDYAGLNALEVRMYDVLGQARYYENILNMTGHYNKVINLSGIPAGVYFLQITSDKGTVNWKIIKK